MVTLWSKMQFNFFQSKKMKVERETADFLKRLRSEYIDFYKSNLLFTVFPILVFKKQELRKYYVRMFSIFWKWESWLLHF